MTDWISVEDRVPDVGVWVAARRGRRRPFTCQWVEQGEGVFKHAACIDSDNNYRDPTIWTPLPELPEN